MNSNLKPGLSGIMRIKNEEQFIEQCIESCISALDELIIVYNDCTDNSVAIIERKQKEYPDKIKIYEYPYKVYGANLTKEEYEYAKSLPDDSPNLLCNYYNFALSKVTCEYAMKIDADQFYFTPVLTQWADVCRNPELRKWKPSCIFGSLFRIYYTLYRRLSTSAKKPLTWMIPKWLLSIAYKPYLNYAKWQLSKGKMAISLSGLNVFKRDGAWYVTMGRKSSSINVLPPYNGEGDHLIFKMSSNLYYQRFDMTYYNVLRSSSYSLIEEFVHPFSLAIGGFCWFHLNANRKEFANRLNELFKTEPNAFTPLAQFLTLPYSSALQNSSKDVFTLYQRVLFALPHAVDLKSAEENMNILESYD